MPRYVRRVKAKAKYQFTTRLFQTRYVLHYYIPLYPRTYAARNKMNRHVISPSMKWPRDGHQIAAANGNEIDFSIKMQNLNSP